MATPETTPELDVQTAEDWQEETNWEKRYKDAQAEITRARQELAQYKQQPQYKEQESNDNDPEQVKSYLRDLGFVSKEELEREKAFNAIMDSNPELKQYGQAIRVIAEKENLPYEDVIEKYWFADKDKLAKAKERRIVGERSFETVTKSIADLSDAEYSERKKQNLWKGNKLQKAGSF